MAPASKPGHVQHQHPLALQGFRHFLVDDALRQTFHDGGLAHARLADQHRVVLGAALQHLDRAADLVVAPDHRVELAHAGALGQVEGVFLQRLALAFGFLALHVFTSAYRIDGLFQMGLVHAVLAQQPPGLALVLRRRQQKQLAGDELVAALHRVLVGQVEQVVEIARNTHLAAVAFHLGQALHGLLQRGLQPADIGAGTLQQRTRAAVVLLEQGQQQVLRLDELVVQADSQALRIADGLLEFGGELVETHGIVLVNESNPYFGEGRR